MYYWIKGCFIGYYLTITLNPILILPVCLSTNNSLSLFVPSQTLAEQKIDPPANLTSPEIKVLVISHTFPITFTSLIGDIGSFSSDAIILPSFSANSQYCS